MQLSIRRWISGSLAALVASVLMVSAGAGVAWAINVDCTVNFGALCVGANTADFLQGEDVNDGVQGRKDVIKGLGGSDGAEGNGGGDKIYGGNGPDGDLA
nr:hypothetical protein [Rubrobacteraceae bacterium]